MHFSILFLWETAAIKNMVTSVQTGKGVFNEKPRTQKCGNSHVDKD